LNGIKTLPHISSRIYSQFNLNTIYFELMSWIFMIVINMI